MLRTSLIAGTALLLGAMPALADCEEDFENLQEKMTSAAVSSEVRRDMNQLRSAARTLVRYQKDGTCEEVIEAIEDIIEVRKEKREREKKRQRFQNATPVSKIKGLVRVDDIKGKDIHDPTGEEIGVVEAVTVDADKGDIAYVVMSHGGFLGIGEKLIAVPWRAFRITDEGDALVLDASDEKLDKAPSFDDDNWPKMSEPGWREKIDSYYGNQKKG